MIKGVDVPADPRREELTRASMLETIAAAGDGHGITDAVKKLGKAFYTFDVKGTPLRILVLDTAAETGGDHGIIHQADIDAFVKPALDQAKAEKKWVIMTSHHASRLLSDGSFLGSSAARRSHRGCVAELHRRLRQRALAPGRPHSPAPGDEDCAFGRTRLLGAGDVGSGGFPHQMRMIEVWDEDNGYLTIRGTALDYQVEGDPVAADGRSRSVVDFTSGWISDGSGSSRSATWLSGSRSLSDA